MKEKEHNSFRLINAIVTLLGIAVSVVCLVWRLNESIPVTSFILVAVYYCFVFYYGVFGYKKPHGNMVRYLLLILALYIAASIIMMVERWDISWFIFAASNFAAVLIGYMAGRLKRMKSNVILAVIITLLLLVKSFAPVHVNGLNFYQLFILDRTMPLFMWVTVMFIYFYRYEEHKHAGITADNDED